MLPQAHLHELDDLAGWYWWHVHRARTVVDLADRFLASARPVSRYLDVGCGPGSSTRCVAEGLVARGLLAPSGAVEGLDPDERLSEMCRRNGVRFHLLSEALGPRAEGPFEIFTALDVLEHLDDPVSLLRPLREWLSPGAVGLFTVPAFQRLYSDWDVAAGHRRRYAVAELAALLRSSGYEVLWTSYFYSFAVLPAMALRRRNGVPRAETRDLPFPRVPGWLNATLKGVSALERTLLRLTPIPVGTSAVAVVRRS
jgi:2-polyprenyl-3-methyl-5-hydroxy-6-metoxy-1,4-benzoquinol methylase